MSLQYGFVTPLTSMVVTKPETEDGTESPLIADKLTEGKMRRRAAQKCLYSIIPADHCILFFTVEHTEPFMSICC